jgi:hypothetical protein
MNVTKAYHLYLPEREVAQHLCHEQGQGNYSVLECGDESSKVEMGSESVEGAMGSSSKPLSPLRAQVL